jgi:hypothetical protein
MNLKIGLLACACFLAYGAGKENPRSNPRRKHPYNKQEVVRLTRSMLKSFRREAELQNNLDSKIDGLGFVPIQNDPNQQ